MIRVKSHPAIRLIVNQHQMSSRKRMNNKLMMKRMKMS